MNDELDSVDHSPQLGKACLHDGLQNSTAYGCCNDSSLRGAGELVNSFGCCAVHHLPRTWELLFADGDPWVESAEVCSDCHFVVWSDLDRICELQLHNELFIRHRNQLLLQSCFKCTSARCGVFLICCQNLDVENLLE